MKVLLVFIVIYVVFRILSSVKFKVVTFKPSSFNDFGAGSGYNREPRYESVKVDSRHDIADDAEDTVNCAACGAYLPVRSALRRMDNGQVRHFCTLPCSDEGKDSGNAH